ncbi:hypothetical protein VOLCADRAFT_104774 [Volvox carteri f. nagariensis]|uniref:Uncharacterized protein n=1 Tax=Volvox carteri f. nagariensis TaxID=3068 RepID=D8TVY1_VOLCA|nr:uncharacterized protein VOLCADRAFT_104774 [Volvox carteri f. nagariensis]EFJ48384.1 hypothetical protein VOLCADRAFT_104774 [Volvox carteri f. nagariensis]|eukprot:XP_002950638.1 hypothetical protein VOLCADRAFT_104774 [Volvox carteri f. nagariensis]
MTSSLQLPPKALLKGASKSQSPCHMHAPKQQNPIQLRLKGKGANNVDDIDLKVYDSDGKEPEPVLKRVLVHRLLQRCIEYSTDKKREAPFGGKSWGACAASGKLTIFYSVTQPVASNLQERKQKKIKEDNCSRDDEDTPRREACPP